MTSDQPVELYFHDTPGPIKVLLFLEECGLPYELVPIDLYKGAHTTPEFKQINPNGKVPALRDGDITVFDSSAILIHLAERCGRFLPRETKARAEALSWLMFIATGLGPFSGQSVHFLHFAEERMPYSINRYAREVERHYQVLDERLDSVPYIAGPDYTIVDMAAWGWIKLAAVALEAGSLDAYPAVKRWFESVDSRPAAIRSREIAARIRAASKTELDDEARRFLLPQNTPGS